MLSTPTNIHTPVVVLDSMGVDHACYPHPPTYIHLLLCWTQWGWTMLSTPTNIHTPVVVLDSMGVDHAIYTHQHTHTCCCVGLNGDGPCYPHPPSYTHLLLCWTQWGW